MSNQQGLLGPNPSWLGAVQKLHDAVLIVGAHVIAWALFGDGPWTLAQSVATSIAAMAFLVVAEACDLYQSWRGAPVGQELERVFVASALAFPLTLVVVFLARSSLAVSESVTLAWLVLAPILVAASRTTIRLVLRRARTSGRNSRSVAIVGATEMGETVATKIANAPWLGMRVVGFYEDRALDRCHPIPEPLGAVVGTFEDLVADARAGRIDIAYMALPLRAEPRVSALVRQLADTTASVYFVPDLHTFHLVRGRWSTLDEIPVISIFESPFYGIDGVVKRIEDIVLGTLALVVAAPAMLFCAITIALTSPGPILFRQRRYGLHGQVIDVLKFRTMRVAEDGPVVTQATKNDDRITPFGRFMRRTSLDELPQLLHVIQGTMSLVGPRPHAIAHNEEYRKRIHGYMLRHKVKPGLTGWAQVNGWRGETDTLVKMEKRVEHDLQYIQRWGLLFDLWIVLLTVASRRAHQNAH